MVTLTTQSRRHKKQVSHVTPCHHGGRNHSSQQKGQMSQMMGWKEGAVRSAMNVVAQVVGTRGYKPPASKSIPPDRSAYE